MKNLKKWCLAIITIALIWSCQKEERVICEEGNKMQFIANYSDSPHTKASTSFTTGNKVTIYACDASSTPSSSTFVEGTPLNATAQSAGILKPDQDLFLPKGSYNFYSVSQNSSTVFDLDFSSGVSEQLTNNIDYLWAKAASISEGGTVNFTYYHKAVGIKIIVSEGTGISNLTVTNIKLTPTKGTQSTKMNLATGVIEPSDNIDVLTPLSISNNSAEKIMLPLTSNALTIEVTANLTIGSASFNNKTYLATIPAREYEGGYYYTLNLEVNAQAIIFSGTQLEDWTNQTITGVSLTEQ